MKELASWGVHSSRKRQNESKCKRMQNGRKSCLFLPLQVFGAKAMVRLAFIGSLIYNCSSFIIAGGSFSRFLYRHSIFSAVMIRPTNQITATTCGDLIFGGESTGAYFQRSSNIENGERAQCCNGNDQKSRDLRRLRNCVTVVT